MQVLRHYTKKAQADGVVVPLPGNSFKKRRVLHLFRGLL